LDAITNCLRKDPYPDEKAARAALAGMKRAKAARGEKIVGDLRAFRCKMGRHWHIGTRDGRRNGRRAR
jgi:hypothetical protein